MTCSIFELRQSRDFALDFADVLVVRMVEIDDLTTANAIPSLSAGRRARTACCSLP